MTRQCLSFLVRMLTAVVLGLASTVPCSAHGGGGHGGGGGHTLAGGGGFRGAPCGFRGGFGNRGFYGYGYPGFFGYPWYGFGWGLGLGYGLGYGMGYGYGSPYGYGYPVYVNPGYGPQPAGAACPVAGPGAAPGAPGGSTPGTPIRLTDADVLLNIRVPPRAVVRINGAPTTQNGPRREFFSSGLLPGRTYTFVVTAQWAGSNGQTVEHEQRVHVQGGERRNVDFVSPAPPPRELSTDDRSGS
jgi:uncharacterized protein (TIGR03000 family)